MQIDKLTSNVISLVYEQVQKLKQKIKNRQSISYDEAENCLLKFGFKVRSKGSHHVFSKDGHPKNISIKKNFRAFALSNESYCRSFRKNGGYRKK